MPSHGYSTQPTVTKLAAERAAELERNTDPIHADLLQRLERDLGFSPRDDNRRGAFHRIHIMPRNVGEVPDELETRLVVLDPDQSYARGQDDSPAEVAAKAILDSRGSRPRVFRNTIVFLAPDQTRLQDLNEAIRLHLAWRSILGDKLELNLDPHQGKASRDAARRNRRSRHRAPA